MRVPVRGDRGAVAVGTTPPSILTDTVTVTDPAGVTDPVAANNSRRNRSRPTPSRLLHSYQFRRQATADIRSTKTASASTGCSAALDQLEYDHAGGYRRGRQRRSHWPVSLGLRASLLAAQTATNLQQLGTNSPTGGLDTEILTISPYNTTDRECRRGGSGQCVRGWAISLLRRKPGRRLCNRCRALNPDAALVTDKLGLQLRFRQRHSTS